MCFKLRDIEEIMIGKKFQMIVDVANKSFKNRTITFALSINSVYYTGTFAKKVKSDNGTFILQPWQSKCPNLSNYNPTKSSRRNQTLLRALKSSECFIPYIYIYI